MAKYVKIQPNETVDAIQVRRHWQMERYYYTPFPKEYEGQPNIGKDCPFVPTGSWIVNDGTEQLIISDDEFQKRFRRVGDGTEPFTVDPAILGPTHVIYDPAKHEYVDGKLVRRKGPIRVCRKCKQVIE